MSSEHTKSISGLRLDYLEDIQHLEVKTTTHICREQLQFNLQKTQSLLTHNTDKCKLFLKKIS
jgi:hypothetical protein